MTFHPTCGLDSQIRSPQLSRGALCASIGGRRKRERSLSNDHLKEDAQSFGRTTVPTAASMPGAEFLEHLGPKDGFYRNAFRIARGHLSFESMKLDVQPRLNALGRQSLAQILCNAALKSIDLANVDLGNQEDVAALVSSLTSMRLQDLGLSRCRLTSRAMGDVALLLRNTPSLRRLNLAAWTKDD